jgi:hypothetical protein
MVLLLALAVGFGNESLESVARAAPVSLLDLNRFPRDRDEVYRAKEFAHAFWVTTENRKHNAPNPTVWLAWDRAGDEALRRYAAWDCLRNAMNLEYDASNRLGWLTQLRQRIGDEAYYSGRMPFPALLEYFQERR